MGLGLSLISKAPSGCRRVLLPKAFVVSALCFPTWLETAQQREREKEKKQKTIFPGKHSALAGEGACLDTPKRDRQPIHSPLQIALGSLAPASLSHPFRTPHPASTLRERPASSDVYSLKFIRHLPAPRLPGSDDRLGGHPGSADALVSNSGLTQTSPAQRRVWFMWRFECRDFADR